MTVHANHECPTTFAGKLCLYSHTPKFAREDNKTRISSTEKETGERQRMGCFLSLRDPAGGRPGHPECTGLPLLAGEDGVNVPQLDGAVACAAGQGLAVW